MRKRVDRLGPWQLAIGEEQVHLTPAQVQVLEEYLRAYTREVNTLYQGGQNLPAYGRNYAMRTWGAPSLAVRFDMAPMLGSATAGIYEIEGNPAGFSFLDLVGLPVGALLANALRDLDISRIASTVAPSRTDQATDHNRLMELISGHGIEVESVDYARTDLNGTPIWMRAGEEDRATVGHLEEKSLLLFRDGGGHKVYLLKLGEGRLLSDFTSVTEVMAAYPNGLVMKPWRSWGTKEVYCYDPRGPFKNIGVSTGHIEKQLERAFDRNEQGRFVIQPFYPPALRKDTDDGKTYCRIWRVFAVWTADGYKVIGGAWNERPSTLRIHGASDALWGPIHTP